MAKVNFSPRDYHRSVADAAALILRNRYFEENPSLTDDGSALLARPGLTKFVELGAGPVRGVYSQAGAFDGDLFAVSYDSLYRVTQTKAVTTLKNGGLFSPDKGFVNMAITANIGDTPEYLWLADGRNLWLYVENGYAQNTIDGIPANNDVVRIDAMYYRFTSGSVDAGTPAGTNANPWLIALGGTSTEAIANLSAAINNTGTAGTQYSTALTSNPVVLVTFTSTSAITVRCTTPGAAGNSIPTTETGANLAWLNGATLTGGGANSVTAVQMPDDVGVIDVAVIASFVIVIPVQDDGINGRFYWIEPGETTVDPLNFATAERSPDAINQVKVVGDNFWLLGESTVEPWYVTGDLDQPVQRLQGVVFDRGSWEATSVAMDEAIVITDVNGRVFIVTGSNPQPISTPDIEEEIRKAIQKQQALIF